MDAGVANTLTGGPGDDVYDVDSSSIVIVEAVDGGIDTVRASVDYTLPDNVENLTLTGAALAGTGNALDNVMVGNDLGNTLRGSGGADSLAGMGGDDVFLAAAADLVAGEVIDGGDGTDVVQIEGSVVADLTGIDLMSIESLEAAGRVRMTAAQVGALGSIHADSLEIATVGEVDLSGIDLRANSVLLTATGAHLIPGQLLRPVTIIGAAGASVTLTDGTVVTFTDAISTATIGTADSDYFTYASADVFDAGAGYDVVELGTKAAFDLRASVSSNIEEIRGFLATVSLRVDQFNQLERNAGLVFYQVAGTGVLKAVSGVEYVTLLNGGTTVDWALADTRVSVTGSNGADKVMVGSHGSSVDGNGGNDVIVGGAGVDALSGGTGNDRLLGGAGNDQLAGGPGVDQLYGGAGDDILAISTADLPGGEIVSGGAGRDRLRVTGYADTQATVDLTHFQISGMEELYPDCFVRMTVGQIRQFDGFNVGKLTVKGTASLDLGKATGYIGWVLLETPGAHLSLTGFAGKTAISGSSGADVIKAADGGSDIKAGAGNDWIYGGIGADTLHGGAGRDRFVFATDPSGPVDHITDFSPTDDSIMLDHAAFAALPVASGSIGRGAFWTGTAAHDGTDRVIYNAQTGAIFYDADGSGAGAQVQFAQVSAGLALTHADFIVI